MPWAKRTSLPSYSASLDSRESSRFPAFPQLALQSNFAIEPSDCTPLRSGSTIQSAKVRSRTFSGVEGQGHLQLDGSKSIEGIDMNAMVILLVEDDVHVTVFHLEVGQG